MAAGYDAWTLMNDALENLRAAAVAEKARNA